MTNYISIESLINVVFDKNIILATFAFINGRGPINRYTTEGYTIELVGYRMPWQDRNSCTVLFTRDQSTKQCQAFRYSDWLER